MLDVMTCIGDDGLLTFRVLQKKKTHTNQYLQYDSHHPLQLKLGVVRTLSHQAKTITSQPDDLDTELHHLEKVLSISGYPRGLLTNPSALKKEPYQRAQNTTKSKGHVTIPYIYGLTELLAIRYPITPFAGS